MQFLNLILIILFGGAAMLALLASVHLLLPRPVENTRAILEGRIGRVFLLGLVNLIFFGAVIIVLVWLANLIRNNWSGLAGILGLLWRSHASVTAGLNSHRPMIFSPSYFADLPVCK